QRTGTVSAARSTRLRPEGRDDRRLCARRCARTVRRDRRQDVHGQPRRRRVRKGSWAEDARRLLEDGALQSGSHVDSGGVQLMARQFKAAALSMVLLGAAGAAHAQERPYFVTYSEHLEDKGELEVSVLSTLGDPKDGTPRYVAPWVEIEYGITSRWTAE